uniref:hypothetical protein n=1 Tax=Bacillus sp. S1-R2T1-FB TaxID=1973493 RepID=UPI001C4FB5B6
LGRWIKNIMKAAVNHIYNKPVQKTNTDKESRVNKQERQYVPCITQQFMLILPFMKASEYWF